MTCTRDGAHSSERMEGEKMCKITSVLVLPELGASVGPTSTTGGVSAQGQTGASLGCPLPPTPSSVSPLVFLLSLAAALPAALKHTLITASYL